MSEKPTYANLPQIQKACAKCFEFQNIPLKQAAINKKRRGKEMRQNTFAAKAAVISAVFVIASSATALTVDTLDKPPFLPTGATTGDVSGNFAGNIKSINVTDPAQFQITVDSVPTTANATLEPAEEIFDSSEPDSDAGGNAAKSGLIAQDPIASGRPAPLPETSITAQSGFNAPAAMAATAAPAAPATATAAVVPLPASGILLCLSLFGLSRFVRRNG